MRLGPQTERTGRDTGAPTEPSFELLAGRTPTGWRSALASTRLQLGLVALGLLACAGLAAQRQRVEEVLAAQRTQLQAAAAASAPSSSASDALQGLTRVAPAGAWLQELEACHPVGATTERLQLDAQQSQVNLVATVAAEVDVDAWVACLNQRAGAPVWGLRQVSAGSEVQAATATGSSSRRVVVVRGSGLGR